MSCTRCFTTVCSEVSITNPIIGSANSRFATESGKLYIAAFDDEEERTIIWTVNPGDETPMLVLRAGDYVPEDILLMDGYLYLLTSTRQVYRYALPLAPELE